MHIQDLEGVKSYLLFLDVSNFVFKAYESILDIGFVGLGGRCSRTESRWLVVFPALIVVRMGLG